MAHYWQHAATAGEIPCRNPCKTYDSYLTSFGSLGKRRCESGDFTSLYHIPAHWAMVLALTNWNCGLRSDF